MLISNFVFANEIVVEDSIEAALVTVIIKNENLNNFCAENNCSESSSLFVEDKTGIKSIVPGLVQVTYFKSFGYELANQQVVSAVSMHKLDANTPDHLVGHAHPAWTTMPPEHVAGFCAMKECVYIGEVQLIPMSDNLSEMVYEESVKVGYWKAENPGPTVPIPGDL